MDLVQLRLRRLMVSPSMSAPTLSEIARNLTEHVKYETGYQERFEEKLDTILQQTTKTNGRVTQLEAWKEREAHPLLEDYKDNRSQAKGVGKLWALFGTSLVAIIILTFTLYIKTLKNDIMEQVIECCSK